MIVVMVPGWQAKVRGPMRQLVLKITDEISDDARTNIISDRTIDTGDMLMSVRQEGQRVYIGTDHWHYIEYGTTPHVIRPSTKQALWWPGLPHPVDTVHHPGTREYAPMRRALFTKRG